MPDLISNPKTRLSLAQRGALFFFTCLGLFVFYYSKLHPILDWIHSDNAVPYLMANTPFDWGDMYYWGTGRNGTPYSFFAKWIFLITNSSLNPQAFYWIHVFAVLAAVASLWFLPLPPLLILSTVLLAVPMTGIGVHNVLLPGQPYSGIIVFFALLLAGLAMRNAIVIGIALSLLMIQHVLAGALGIFIVLGDLLLNAHEVTAKKNRVLFPILGALAVFSWFKWQSPSTDSFRWFDVVPLKEFYGSLKVLFQYGLATDAPFGWTGLLLFFIGLTVGVYVVAVHFRSRESYWGYLLLGWILGSLLLLASSRWFFYNSRNYRYALVVSFGAVLLLLLIAKKRLFPPSALFISFFILLLLKPMPLLFRKNPYPGGFGNRLTSIVEEAKALGCKGVFGGYWDTYFIGTLTRMTIVGSPYPYMRNKAFHDRVMAERPLCWVPSEEGRPAVEQYISSLNLECPASEPSEKVRRCHSK